MAEDENNGQLDPVVKSASAETGNLLDKVFENLKNFDPQKDLTPPKLFPNGVTSLNVELSLGLSPSPSFKVQVQISGPATASGGTPQDKETGDQQQRQINAAPVSPVRFRIRRHTNAELDNARADSILSDGAAVLKAVDGTGDVSCAVDLGRDGSVETFSVGNGIISSQADYDAVCAESNHAHRIYIVNQILYCGGNTPDPGFIYIGCSDTPGSCMILARTDDDEEAILWMHEYGHTRGLPHRDNNSAVMHRTVASNHKQVNQTECNAYQGSHLFAAESELGAPQPSQKAVDARAFVRQVFIHGLPLEEAEQFPSSSVPQLLEMLSDDKERRYWANIATMLCAIGDAQVIEPLIQFARSGEGILSRHEYDAKTAAVMSLGRLIRKGEMRDYGAALDFLTDSLNSDGWTSNVKWMNPYNLSRDEQTVQLSKVGVWGLALTGKPEAAEVLRSFQERNVKEISTRDARGAQSLNDLAEEALRYHDKISR